MMSTKEYAKEKTYVLEKYEKNTSEEVKSDANLMRIYTYYAIIVSYYAIILLLLAEVQKRKCAYDNINKKFGFLVTKI